MQKSKPQLIHALLIGIFGVFQTACQSPDSATCQPHASEKQQMAVQSQTAFSMLDIIRSNTENTNSENQQHSPGCNGNQEQISEYVRRIFCDSKVNYWFGTNALGVARYTAGKGTYFSLDQGLGGTQVTGILEDKKGRIWVSNSGGAAMIEGEKVTHYGKAAGLKNDRLWCIMEDSKGTIWVGGEDGVYQFDGNRFHPFSLGLCKTPLEMADEKPTRISSIMEDSQGNLWFGTEGKGAIKYDGEKFTHLTMEHGLVDNHIVCILEDKNGNLWFSSRFHGLGYYDGQTFTNFSTATGLGNDEVWNMMEDKDGNIWFSSEGFGVYKYDGQDFTNYGEKEGLGVRAVQTIYQDHNGKIWAGGGGGLYRMDDGRFINIKRKGPWNPC